MSQWGILKWEVGGGKWEVNTNSWFLEKGHKMNKAPRGGALFYFIRIPKQ